MRIIIQRVKQASCEIDGKIYSQIEDGLLLLVGFCQGDDERYLEYFVNKICKMRIFSDDFGKLNLSIKDIRGKILSISQFTLYAYAYNGNRPSFTNALNFEKASLLYDKFNSLLQEQVETKVGVFGADMKINLINDGPVTIILDSKDIEEANHAK